MVSLSSYPDGVKFRGSAAVREIIVGPAFSPKVPINVGETESDAVEVSPSSLRLADYLTIPSKTLYKINSIFENGIDGSQPPIVNDSNCSTENNNNCNDSDDETARGSESSGTL